MPRLNDVVQFCLSIEGCDTPRSEFSPLCHPSARLVVRGPRLSKWLHKDGSSTQHGLCHTINTTQNRTNNNPLVRTVQKGRALQRPTARGPPRARHLVNG